MKISIITVCFNSVGTIADTFKSIRSQEYENYELIVIDGGSTDGTQNIIEKNLDIISYYISEPDAGIYDGMNKGIRRCTGDVIGILNSDDIYAHDRVLLEVSNAFSQYKNLPMLFGGVEFRDFNNGEIVRIYSAKRFKPFKLRFGWMPPHPATFIRAEVYSKYGLYRTDMKISSDFERFVRWLYVEKLEYRYIDSVFVHMRTGGISTAGLSSSFRLNSEIVKGCRDNGLHTNLLIIAFKIPFKLLELMRLKLVRK